MNREIKFRAWDGNVCIISGEDLSMSDFWKTVEIGGYPVMQSTGLKDKNGVLIYEGDLFRYLGGIWEVRWSNKEMDNLYGFDQTNCGFVGFENKNKRREYLKSIVYKGSEIIGNIYSNPELLK